MSGVKVKVCPSCGHRWGGKRKAQQINRKKALQAYNKLNEKNVDILWSLYKYRLVSKLQVGNAFFVAKNPDDRERAAKNRLNHLINVGLAKRLKGDNRHNYKHFFTPTQEGTYVCQAEEKQAGNKVKTVKDLKAEDLMDSPKWLHHAYVIDVMSSFTAAEQRGEGELQSYKGDGQTCYRFVAWGNRLRLMPDSTILWSSDGKARLCWLELENKRSSYDDIIEKIRRYTLLWSDGKYEDGVYKVMTGQDAFPVLLVVGVRRGHLDGLRQAILSGVLQAKSGTLQELSREIVIGLTCLDDVVDLGVTSKIYDAVLQGLGRHLDFNSLFDLRVGLEA